MTTHSSQVEEIQAEAEVSAKSSRTKQKTESVACVVIVDDEESIRRTVSAVLSDEGFQVQLASDGDSGLALLEELAQQNKFPRAVMLDIWMPGRDGLEVLGLIKQRWPDLPVIMMSGHATIATAVKATRLGAVEFLEKPLDLNRIVQTLKNVGADTFPVTEEAPAIPSPNATTSPSRTDRKALKSPAFASTPWAGKRFPQKTIRHSAIMYGQGLHSGQKSGLILEPLPPHSGIHFASVSESSVVPAYVDFVESTGFATTVRLERTHAGTIEHLMSSLHAYGVSNLLIKCNGEVPVLDGSAREFCALLDAVGTVDQSIEDPTADWFAIRIQEPIRIGTESEYLLLEPSDNFHIDYTLRYPEPIGEQSFSFTLEDSQSFLREIAPARTFGFVKDVGLLQQQGLALGGRFDNFVLLGESGAINTAMRFPDEPVRHKILDAIGDLFLLGRPLQAKVTAHMTGHSDNVKMAAKIAALLRGKS